MGEATRLDNDSPLLPDGWASCLDNCCGCGVNGTIDRAGGSGVGTTTVYRNEHVYFAEDVRGYGYRNGAVVLGDGIGY